MKLLILIVGSLLLAIVITSISLNYDGVITATFSDLTVQTSLTFFILIIITFFVVMYYSAKLISNLLGARQRFKNWKLNKNQRLSEKYLSLGLQALFEGNWQLAEKFLKKGIPYSRKPLVNYLGAARAAQYLGAPDRRDKYLNLASNCEQGNESIAVGLIQAEKQLSQQQSNSALSTLTNLHEKYPENIQVKSMLLETCINQKDWNTVLKLVTELKNNKLLSNEKIKSLQFSAYSGLLIHAGESGNKIEVDHVWQEIPAQLRNEIYLLETYAAVKLKLGDSVSCEPLIRNMLKKHWDDGLIKMYGLIEGNDFMKQLKFAEKLLTGHSNDAVLLLTLGRLSIRNSLWGKAKGYFEESIDIKPMPETYRELAALLDRQGEHMAANVYYQKGLTLATSQDLSGSVQMLDYPEDQNAVCNVARQIV